MGVLMSVYATCSHVYQRLKPSPVRAEESAIRAVLRPGDLITLRGVLTERWWPGWWSHVGLCVGEEGGVPLILEARAKNGVHFTPLSAFLTGSYAAVLRPQLPKETIVQALAKARALVGAEFDFRFDFADTSRIACTELVYHSYRDFLPIPTSVWLGKTVVFADSFFSAPFDVVYLSPGGQIPGEEVPAPSGR